MNEVLKQKLNKLPTTPGVYFHKNSLGEIIYVGKAAVLKNRVRQYFQNSKKDIKTQALVREIVDTDWITVETEMDALFLESEMIKRYMPKWNILLRDDKTVSYVRIDMKSEVPHVAFTRNPIDDGATYIGPFYGKAAVEKAVRTLRRIFPYYVRPYTGKKTLDTDLGLTPGIEIGKCSAKDYKRNLRKLIRCLEGEREELIRELEKTMAKESAAGNYELAAEARDQIRGLKELRKKIVFSDKEFLDISSDRALKQLQDLLGLAKPPRRIEGYDISHQSGENTVGSMVVFINGAATRSEYRKFKVKSSKNDDLKSLQEVLTRRLKHSEWDFPDLIIVDGGEGQVRALLPLLQPLNIPIIGRDKSGDHGRNAKVKLVFPQKPTASRPSETTYEIENEAQSLCVMDLALGSHVGRLIARVDEEAHRFAITYHSLLQRKNMLK